MTASGETDRAASTGATSDDLDARGAIGCAGVMFAALTVLACVLAVNRIGWLQADKQVATFTSTSVMRSENSEGPDSFSCLGRLDVHGDPVRGTFTLHGCGLVGKKVEVLRVGTESVVEENSAKPYAVAWLGIALAVVSALATLALLWAARPRRRKAQR